MQRIIDFVALQLEDDAAAAAADDDDDVLQ